VHRKPGQPASLVARGIIDAAGIEPIGLEVIVCQLATLRARHTPLLWLDARQLALIVERARGQRIVGNSEGGGRHMGVRRGQGDAELCSPRVVLGGLGEKDGAVPTPGREQLSGARVAPEEIVEGRAPPSSVSS